MFNYAWREIHDEIHGEGALKQNMATSKFDPCQNHLVSAKLWV